MSTNPELHDELLILDEWLNEGIGLAYGIWARQAVKTGTAEELEHLGHLTAELIARLAKLDQQVHRFQRTRKDQKHSDGSRRLH
jgi:hypothetical protein